MLVLPILNLKFTERDFDIVQVAVKIKEIVKMYKGEFPGALF